MFYSSLSCLTGTGLELNMYIYSLCNCKSSANMSPVKDYFLKRMTTPHALSTVRLWTNNEDRNANTLRLSVSCLCSFSFNHAIEYSNKTKRSKSKMSCLKTFCFKIFILQSGDAIIYNLIILTRNPARTVNEFPEFSESISRSFKSRVEGRA